MAEISNGKIYDLINAMRLELKGDIRDLTLQFQTLEAGRLTRLEGKVQDMQVADVKTQSKLSENQAVISTKMIIVFAVGDILFTALLTGLFTRLFK